VGVDVNCRDDERLLNAGGNSRAKRGVVEERDKLRYGLTLIFKGW
jgi:hypothetical protein